MHRLLSLITSFLFTNDLNMRVDEPNDPLNDRRTIVSFSMSLGAIYSPIATLQLRKVIWRNCYDIFESDLSAGKAR